MTATPPYFLTTRRLGFRTWRASDFDLAMGLWGDPRVTRLFDRRGALSADQVRQKLDREIATQRNYAIQYWPIFETATGVHVGCTGLRPKDPARSILELGFHIRPDHWRKGYAGEAAQAVIDHAFRRLALAGVFAGHHPENTVSRCLLLKLGFEHTHDEYYPPTGRKHPSYLLTAAAHRRQRAVQTPRGLN